MLALIYTNRAAHVIIPKADTAVTQSNRHYALAASSRDSWTELCSCQSQYPNKYVNSPASGRSVNATRICC